MKKTNALEMRRSLGKVLRELERDGKPILVEKDRRPTAVLISLRDYQERFVDRVAAEERLQLIEEILATRRQARRRGKKGRGAASRAARSVAMIGIIDASVAVKCG